MRDRSRAARRRRRSPCRRRAEQREALEGMYVTLPQPLTILEYFEFGRYGTRRSRTRPSVTSRPRSSSRAPEAIAARRREQPRWSASRSTTDEPSRTPTRCATRTATASAWTNNLRAGDQLTNVTGVLDYHFGTWAVQPTQAADYTAANPRPDVPEVGGDLVCRELQRAELLHDTTSGSRGRIAESRLRVRTTGGEDRERLAAIDADVFGLIEIENNATDAAADDTRDCAERRPWVPEPMPTSRPASSEPM